MGFGVASSFILVSALVAAPAAPSRPNVLVLPLASAIDAPQADAERFRTHVLEALAGREDVLGLVPTDDGESKSASAPKSETTQAALDAFEEGKRLLGELRFDLAAAAFDIAVDKG